MCWAPAPPRPTCRAAAPRRAPERGGGLSPSPPGFLFFLPRWSRGGAAGAADGAPSRPSSPPRFLRPCSPRLPLGCRGVSRIWGNPGLAGPQSPGGAGTRRRVRGWGQGLPAGPGGAAPTPHLRSCSGPAGRRCREAAGVSEGSAQPWHLRRELGPDGSPRARGDGFVPGRAPLPRSPVGGSEPRGAGPRRSREEGKAEARLLVRIVIFHQSPAICVSAPDRTPAVLLAGVTETTQRWRRANCICSPAHRSKLRPSHGAGKGAKGPCDMREI